MNAVSYTIKTVASRKFLKRTFDQTPMPEIIEVTRRRFSPYSTSFFIVSIKTPSTSGAVREVYILVS